MEARRCGRCGDSKPLDEFAWRRIKKGQRDNYCRPCRAAYKQEHYIRNRGTYLENARRRTDAELDRRYALLGAYFENHPCADCGETDLVVLEFDHLGEKSFNVAYEIRARSWEAVLAEIEKCDVVCANCHKRRTAARLGSRRHRMTQLLRYPKLFD